MKNSKRTFSRLLRKEIKFSMQLHGETPDKLNISFAYYYHLVYAGLNNRAAIALTEQYIATLNM